MDSDRSSATAPTRATFARRQDFEVTAKLAAQADPSAGRSVFERARDLCAPDAPAGSIPLSDAPEIVPFELLHAASVVPDLLPGLVQAYRTIDKFAESLPHATPVESAHLGGLLSARHQVEDAISAATPTTPAGAGALIRFALEKLAEEIGEDGIPEEAMAPIERALAFLERA